MKRLIVRGTLLLSLAVALIFLARQRIWSSSGLEDVCKEKTQAYFIAKGDTPTQWMPAMLSIANEDLLTFYGSWHVNTRHFVVQCSARTGKLIEDVGYEIAEQP